MITDELGRIRFIGFLDVRDLIQIIVFEQKQAQVPKAAAFGTPDRVKYLTRSVTEFVCGHESHNLTPLAQSWNRLVKVGARMYDQPGDGTRLMLLFERSVGCEIEIGIDTSTFLQV